MKKTGSVLTAMVLTAILASDGFAQNVTAGGKIGVGFADLARRPVRRVSRGLSGSTTWRCSFR
jgi:hypothetical protein